MDTAPQDFYVRGLVILWTACPFKKRILSMFLSASERVGLRWTNKEDTQILLRLLFFSFFFKWRGKIFIFKLRFFFCPVWINMLFVIKWLFFLFVHSVSQANADTLNALNVPHVGKKRKSKKKLNWCLFFFSQCQMLDYWTCIHGGELTIWGGEYLCQTCEILQQSFTTFKGLVAVW